MQLDQIPQLIFISKLAEVKQLACLGAVQCFHALEPLHLSIILLGLVTLTAILKLIILDSVLAMIIEGLLFVAVIFCSVSSD